MAVRYSVPYEAFWDMNPKRLRPWQNLYNEKVQDDVDTIDYAAWLHGTYVALAIAACIDGKKSPYPEQAISIQQREARKAENERIANEIAAAKFKAWAEAFNRSFKEKHDGESTSQRTVGNDRSECATGTNST